jgi:2,4-dienoyl-CoA reductase-like NADH-dependent reductase (Old Yellow Enzyme family)
VLRNRIAKAAMEEGMAGRAQLPNRRLISLYRCWWRQAVDHHRIGSIIPYQHQRSS